MKTDKKQVIEIVGIFGVIASLMFVGMQLILDRRIAIAEQYQSRADLRIQTTLGQFENGDYIQDTVVQWEANRPAWWTNDIERIYKQSGEPMSTIVRRTIYWQMFGITMDNNYYQYKQGLFEEENWLDSEQVIRNALRNPMRRAFYENMPLPSLTEVIEKLTLETESENAR